MRSIVILYSNSTWKRNVESNKGNSVIWFFVVVADEQIKVTVSCGEDECTSHRDDYPVHEENIQTDAEETQGTHEVNLLKLIALPHSVSDKWVGLALLYTGCLIPLYRKQAKT